MLAVFCYYLGMRKQQAIWNEEHTKVDAFPSYALPEPSSMVVEFVKFLRTNNANDGKVIDIGCGKGRNSIYLAEQGFQVYAVDYIQEAIDYAKNQAKHKNVQDSIIFINAAIDVPWQFENNFFDFAVDCFSSIDIETKDGREIYKQEMYRTLKPGGYALVSVVSTADEMEAEMIKQSPGIEPNSTIWPGNGKFQKDYTEPELREFYNKFEIVELKEVKKKSVKLNREFMATNFRLILRKL